MKRKCEFCDTEYDDNENWESLFKNGFKICPNCTELYELKDFLKDYSDRQIEKSWKHEIHEKNMIEDKEKNYNGVRCFSSRHFETSYEVQCRSRYINELIEKIEYARNYLVLEVGAQFEILDSIYEAKDIFWNESGNLLKFVHNASFEYVVIKLKELLSNKESKYSIPKFKNIFTHNKKRIFGEQKILELFSYDNGDSFKIEYDPFPITEFLERIDSLLSHYKDIIISISHYRDNYFAHISFFKSKKPSVKLSYVNLKMIYNMIRLIYDGFLFALAPDKYSTIIANYNIWFSHLNDIAKKYKKDISNNS